MKRDIEIGFSKLYETNDEKISNSFDLPKLILFGNELIELDESMFTNGLCEKCKPFGYCKREDSSKLSKSRKLTT